MSLKRIAVLALLLAVSPCFAGERGSGSSRTSAEASETRTSTRTRGADRSQTRTRDEIRTNTEIKFGEGTERVKASKPRTAIPKLLNHDLMAPRNLAIECERRGAPVTSAIPSGSNTPMSGRTYRASCASTTTTQVIT